MRAPAIDTGTMNARRSILLVAALACAALASAQAPDAPRLSVLYFSNTAGAAGHDWLRKGLADMLAGDLGGGGGVAIVEREELERVLREQELALSGLVDPGSAPAVGMLLGADLLLYGSFLVVGTEIRMDAKVVRVETGVAAAVASVSGPAAEVLALERRLAVKLADGLGVPLAPAAPLPAIEAARTYYAGLDLMDSGDYAAAIEQFTVSTRLDPLYAKPARGIEEAYAFLKDFRNQRYRREMNALVEDAAALAARIASPRFYSFADALMAPRDFGYADQAAVAAAYGAHPQRMAGDSPAQAIWYLQNILHELARAAVEHFDDGAFAEGCYDEVMRWASVAETAWKADPFFPEVLYQTTFVYVGRKDWDGLRALCERLMIEYPDFRMMWAVEDFYERALDELSGG